MIPAVCIESIIVYPTNHGLCLILIVVAGTGWVCILKHALCVKYYGVL